MSFFRRFSKHAYKGWQIPLATVLLISANPLSQVRAEPSQPASQLPAQAIQTETDYTLGAGDRIYVDIFQEEDYSGEYLVLVDGTISLPLAGKVQVQGLTLTEANDLISQRYARYLRLPVVTTSMIAPRPLTIAIAGEVKNPGAYTINLEEQGKFPSVVNIVQRAGGLTATADIRQVQVRRSIKGQEQVMMVNLWELLAQGNQRDNLALRDGDTVFIPTSDTINTAETRKLVGANFGIQANQPVNVAVIGEVYRPGSYEVQPEIINESGSRLVEYGRGGQPPKLTQAIDLAGGIKPLANVRKIEVRRQTGSGTLQTIDIDLWALLQEGDISQDVLLEDGDTIIIPTAEDLDPSESETLAAASFSPDTINVNVVGEVEAPGLIELPPNSPLNKAVLAAGGFNNSRANKSTVELIRLNPNGTVSKREIEVDLGADLNEENNPTLRNNDVVVVARSGIATFSDGLETVLSPLGALFTPVNLLLRIF